MVPERKCLEHHGKEECCQGVKSRIDTGVFWTFAHDVFLSLGLLRSYALGLSLPCTNP